MIDLHTCYNLPLAAAEKLVEELKAKLFLDSSFLADGEIYYRAIVMSEPAGKPLKSCKLKRIKLTLLAGLPAELPFNTGGSDKIFKNEYLV